MLYLSEIPSNVPLRPVFQQEERKQLDATCLRLLWTLGVQDLVNAAQISSPAQ